MPPVERRMTTIVALIVVFLVCAVFWDAFVRPPRARRARLAAPPVVPGSVAGDSARARPAPVAAPPQAVPQSGGPADQTSYLVLLARSDARRRIRASAGLTYLTDIVAASSDSMLHRWDNRILRPVRVYLAPGRVANYQPPFLDAVRRAFQRWQDAGVPVRFDLDADSAAAEVRFKWRIQFDEERTGQTELEWDRDGRLLAGVVTLATFDPKGQPLAVDDVQVVALHEIGHLIGLDHSPDSTDLMFAISKVRDLSARDIQTARLLYDLSPGSLR
jgi:Matrixin